VDITAHPSRVTPLMISLDLTCGCYEDVYAESEWDIVNVSLPSMTSIYLSVNHRPRATVHLPFTSARQWRLSTQLGYKGWMVEDYDYAEVLSESVGIGRGFFSSVRTYPFNDSVGHDSTGDTDTKSNEYATQGIVGIPDQNANDNGNGCKKAHNQRDFPLPFVRHVPSLLLIDS
jgi:hypothetical protein